MDSNKNTLKPAAEPHFAFAGQQRAVNSDDKIITVSAGAGTGKTWVLSNRYARLLLSSDDILPRDILTLTYTEAAASEMKRRIEDRVIKILDEDKNKNISSERRNAIIDGFGEAWISTIHSFAARIIHESGLALDIDPKAAVISGPQEENFWNGISQAAEFGNLKALARAYGNSKLIRLARELDNDKNISYAVGRWGARALSDLAKNTAELHASLGDNWERFLQSAKEEFFIKNARNILRGIMNDFHRDVFEKWGEIFDNLRDIITEKSDKGKGTGNRALYECMNYYYECRNNINDETLGNFYNKILFDKNIKSHSGEPFKSIKAELDGMTLADWRKTLPAINTEAEFSDVEIKFHTSLLKFCALSWGLWDNMKRRRGFLSFSDMILHAQDVIKKQDDLKKFKYILVDEFQDTDPLQFKLIQAIAGHDEKIISDDAAGLFAVGDLKQSIYGFRHAEPELFAKMINANSDSNIELDVSFRTRPELLERINNLFAHIWEKGLGTSEAMRLVKFKKVSAAREKSGNIPPFSLIIFQNDNNNGNTKLDEARALLARELARKILYWVKSGFKVWDKGTDELRPVKFSDFAILLRNRAPYEILEQVFNNEGVPSVQDLSKNYFSRGEVGDIINLLRAAADKSDNASVAGWLMSPFSGVNRADAVKYIEDIKNIKNLKSENINIYENLPSEVQKKLDYLAQVGLREGAAELIAVFDRDRRWLEKYKDDERLRVIRNLRSAMSLARSFQLQSGENASSLNACADWMIQAMRHGVNMEEPSWHDPEDNSVLFTTIHKSKGLEYPVTIIFDTSSSSGAKNEALRPSKELGVIFSSLPDELQDDFNAKCLAEWDKFLSERGEHDEDMRLFYVAATRAQDALIICGIADSSKSAWANLALNRMAESGEGFNGGNVTFVKSDSAQNLDFSVDLNDLNLNDKNYKNLNIAHVQLPDKKFLSLNEFSATSFAMYEWCPAAWRMRYRQGIDLKYAVDVPESLKFAMPDDKNQPEIETYDKNTAGGADVGSLAHWTLSRSISNASKFFESLTRGDVPVYLRSVWDNGQSRDLVLEILKSFENSEAYSIISGAMSRGAKNNFTREAKFRINLDKIILTGAMDLVWHDGGAWHVWDYKTTLTGNAPDELYKSQLDFYALVLRESAKLNNETFSSVNAGLIYLREGGRIESWNVGGWDDLRRRIIDAAHNAVSGEFKINSDRCAVCPFRNDCVFR